MPEEHPAARPLLWLTDLPGAQAAAQHSDNVPPLLRDTGGIAQPHRDNHHSSYAGTPDSCPCPHKERLAVFNRSATLWPFQEFKYENTS